MKSDKEIYFEIRMVKQEINKLNKKKRYKCLAEKESNHLKFLIGYKSGLKWSIDFNGKENNKT